MAEGGLGSVLFPDFGRLERKLDDRFGELVKLLEAILEELGEIRGEISALQS